MSVPVLAMYDPTLPLALHTDVSTRGLGAMLYQGMGRKKRVLLYCSRVLLPAETHYPVMELESLAAVWAIEQNRHYLFGRSFIVVTDHHSLCYLCKLKNPCNRITH